MTQTYRAIDDGVVFRPKKQVKIKPITRVRIIVEVYEESTKTAADVASHLFGEVDFEAPGELSTTRNIRKALANERNYFV